MAQLTWSLALKVVGSSSMSMSVSRDPVEIEAVDRIEVTIKSKPEDTVVEIQPMDGERAIYALMVKASKYDDDPDKLSFKVDGGDSIGLEGPQFFSGGSMALFDKTPRSLKFTNTTGEDVGVEVFVARDATQ